MRKTAQVFATAKNPEGQLPDTDGADNKPEIAGCKAVRASRMCIMQWQGSRLSTDF
jgi:hypothetical protein